jgi:hypothetical protein
MVLAPITKMELEQGLIFRIQIEMKAGFLL